MKSSQFGIKTRFIVLIGIAVLFIATITSLFIYSFTKIRKNDNTEELVNQLTAEYQNMIKYEQSFLTKHNEDKGFYKTGRHRFINSFVEASINFNRTLDKLELVYENTATMKKIDALRIINNQYSTLFNQLHRYLYARGSITSGVIGNLNRNAENVLKYKASRSISKICVKLNNDYKNYLLYVQPEYSNQFNYTFEQIANLINNTKVNKTSNIDSLMIEEDKSVDGDLIKELNSYKVNFNHLYDIDKKIGFNLDDGLKKSLSDEILKFEPELKIIKDQTDEIKTSFIKKTIKIFIVLGIVLLFTMITVGWILLIGTSRMIKSLNVYFKPLSKGILPRDPLVLKNSKELNIMTDSLNELIKGLKRTTHFAEEIGQGTFSTQFEPLSRQDSLGNSLIEMRKNLIKAQDEEEKRHEDDNLRKWANEGLAEFNEILRQNAGNIDDLTLSIVRNITTFLKANQSGLFLINDSNKEDIHLELIATYAYDQERKKQKKIYIGEGLVGMCAVEKSTVYLEDIPQGYLSINSGLGGASPRSLLIVPLNLEDEIFGVLEIASFNKLKKHEIEFVERVTESISSTLSLAKINTRTAVLLEKSQRQAEEMASQEEEMRQNFEELQATQEESSRREAEMNNIMQAINSASLAMEFDLNGYIINANDAFLKLLDIEINNLVGKHQSDFEGMDEKNIRPEEFWKRLGKGEIIYETHKIFSGTASRWLYEMYTPVINEEGEPYKILNFAVDITESKRLEAELQEKTKEMQLKEEELTKTLKELEAAQQKMQKKQKTLEKDNESAKNNTQKLKAEIKKIKENEMRLKSRNAELANQEINYVKQAQEAEINYLGVKQENEKYEKLVSKLTSSENSLKSILKDMKKQNENLESKLKEKKQEEMNLLEEIDTLIKEIERLKTKK